MSKIPKNLSDKDMFKDYVEDTSIEDRFRAAEKKAEKKAKESVEAPADFLRAGFTPQLTEHSCSSRWSSTARMSRIIPSRSSAMGRKSC